MAASNFMSAYDHIVVVVEENHSASEIIGNPQAPYINALASGGALLTNYHAVTHPSQPNYFALYAGSTFGVQDSGDHTLPDPTLATILQDSGRNFIGYVDPGSPRRHNPWESFPEGFTVERNIGAFPSDFSQLPDVAFVIPNLIHDMHDGTVAQADQWLSDTIGAYAVWAPAHHSLLVVVWDEDDLTEGNRVPAILYGANINSGTYNTSYNHYDILASLAGSFALTAPNNGATAAGLSGGIFRTSLAQWSASVDVGLHPAGYVPALVGDFNRDGTSDLIWYNASTRDVDLWKLVNGQLAGGVDVGSHPAGWTPLASGDFNRDGTSDVLWFNAATNGVDLWKLVNGRWAGSVGTGTHPAGYQPVGAGDFNRDGTSDVLWFNPSTGDVDLWKISNGQWAGSVDIGVHPAGYQPVGIGDFNHDGTSDILWFNASTRDVDIWLIQGGRWAASVGVGTHPAGWSIAGVGDFNRDGTSDVLWFNSTTDGVEIWEIRNGHWAASVDLGAHPGWSIAGIGDLNHDGASDILWQDSATGRIENWLLAAA
ncbi:MAG: alkaline phosphatase family protein [Xanthobacteraceae bacterium]